MYTSFHEIQHGVGRQQVPLYPEENGKLLFGYQYRVDEDSAHEIKELVLQ
jgi:hypothetical protein